jgi:hypothetical protein
MPRRSARPPGWHSVPGGQVFFRALHRGPFVPASTSARARWGGEIRSTAGSIPRTAAYDGLAADGMDAGGLIRLATRTPGAPFVDGFHPGYC